MLLEGGNTPNETGGMDQGERGRQLGRERRLERRLESPEVWCGVLWVCGCVGVCVRAGEKWGTERKWGLGTPRDSVPLR